VFNSIRARLTVWYALVLSCVLIAFACTAYLLVQRNFARRSDASIVEQADSFLRTVHAELNDPAEGGNLKESIESAISEHRFRDTLFVVLDSAGNVVGNSNADQEHPNAEEMQTLSRFRGDETRVDSSFQTIRLGRRSFRVYLHRFPANGTAFTLAVLQSTHPQDEFLETLAGTFAVVIPAAVLLASLAGYFLARRNLRPVAAMAQQASLISADNLHKRLEIHNSADELGQLAGSFNELLDRLDRAFEQQRRFIADASHELRTPVAILFGESDVALSQPSRAADDYRESLEILRTEAARLRFIIEDLFTLARVDAGQYRLTKTNFDLEELVAECVQNMRSLAAKRGVTMRSNLSAREMSIDADGPLLRRMLLNIIDNALKYTPAGGTVSVACQQNDDGYTVSVEDSGPGVSSDLHEKIFERFFRVDPARSRAEGNNGGAGLGLSISRLIATAHGGELRLTRSDETGSLFTVWLPKSMEASLIPHLSAHR
jgi:two-component system, OmpR family, sensor kinase